MKREGRFFFDKFYNDAAKVGYYVIAGCNSLYSVFPHSSFALLIC